MAISITNANANISDTTLSYALTYTGRTGVSVAGDILVNGIVIGSATTTSTSTVTVSITSAKLYTAAAGSTRSGAVTFRLTDLNTMDDPVGSSSKTGGNITINARLGTATVTEPSTTSSREWIMDNTTSNTLTTSWTRPNVNFYARLKGYVNGTLVFNRYGYTTSSNTDIDAYGYHAAVVSAMGGVSPATFALEAVTQWDDGTGDYEDFSAPAQVTKTNSIRYYAYELSTGTITSNLTLYNTTTTVPYTLTELVDGYTHVVDLYVRVSGVDTLVKEETGVTTSGNINLTAAERTIILNAMLPSTSADIFLYVTTGSIGSTASGLKTITIDSSMIATDVIASVDSSMNLRVWTKLVEGGTFIDLSSVGVLTTPTLIEGTVSLITVDSSENITVNEIYEGTV